MSLTVTTPFVLTVRAQWKPHYKVESITQRNKCQSQRLAPKTTYKTFPVQPPEGEENTTNLRREIFSKKGSFTLFYFIISHSFIPNLSIGGVVAGTAPVTIHEEVVSSSKGIGDNWALSTDEIHTSSVWRRLWGLEFFKFAFENEVSINFCFEWSPISILQPWPSKSRLL